MTNDSEQPKDKRPDEDDLTLIFAPPSDTTPPPPAQPATQPFAALTEPPTAQPYGPPPRDVPPYGPPGATPPYGQPGPYGWPQPGFQGYPGYPGWQQGPREWSGYAITSLVTGILGFACCLWAVGIGFGIAALRTIPRRNQRGRGMAIAGIVLSCLWVVLSVVLVATGAVGRAKQHGAFDLPAPSVSASGLLPGRETIYDLKPGDCFDKPDDSATSAYEVSSKPCWGPHYGEVYALATLDDSSFPGDQQVLHEADQGCSAKMTDYLGATATLPDAVKIRFFHPTASTWTNPSHHFATCFFTGANGKLSGSVRTGASVSPSALPKA
jgi:hypothetical protein